MALRKHGTGQILRDEDLTKESSKEGWTEKDEAELAEENKDEEQN